MDFHKYRGFSLSNMLLGILYLWPIFMVGICLFFIMRYAVVWLIFINRQNSCTVMYSSSLLSLAIPFCSIIMCPPNFQFSLNLINCWFTNNNLKYQTSPLLVCLYKKYFFIFQIHILIIKVGVQIYERRTASTTR